MAYSEAKKEYNQKYARENLKRVPLDVQKDFYEEMKAAADAVGQKVNAYIKQAIKERMERETAGRSDAPLEAAQRPTEAVTAFQNETTPPQTGTPSEAHRGRPGVVMGNAASESGDGEQVTSSPTHDLNSTEAEKLPSEYTYADFEAMDDEAFKRFVKMSGQELGRYLLNVDWVDRTKVISRWERAQRLEKQRRQRELDYN